MDKEVFKSQLREALSGDFESLLEDVAAAVGQAQAGRIIANSEEAVRDATARFRQRAYEQALGLRQAAEEAAFSPWAGPGPRVEEQGSSIGDVPDGERSD